VIRIALALLIFALPAHAEWTTAQRTTFLRDCTSSCEGGFAPNDPLKTKCGGVCRCVAEQAETFMTPADYDRVDAANQANRKDPLRDRMDALLPPCARKMLQQR